MLLFCITTSSLIHSISCEKNETKDWSASVSFQAIKQELLKCWSSIGKHTGKDRGDGKKKKDKCEIQEKWWD